MKENGYEIEADGKVITVFSAPNYCDQMGNKGAYIIFKGSDMKPDIKTFSAVVSDSIYLFLYSRHLKLHFLIRNIRKFQRWLIQEISRICSEESTNKQTIDI